MKSLLFLCLISLLACGKTEDHYTVKGKTVDFITNEAIPYVKLLKMYPLYPGADTSTLGISNLNGDFAYELRAPDVSVSLNANYFKPIKTGYVFRSSQKILLFSDNIIYGMRPMYIRFRLISSKNITGATARIHSHFLNDHENILNETIDYNGNQASWLNLMLLLDSIGQMGLKGLELTLNIKFADNTAIEINKIIDINSYDMLYELTL